jgi:hypothetical protein
MREYLRREVLAQPESRNMRSQKERDELRALGYL